MACPCPRVPEEGWRHTVNLQGASFSGVEFFYRNAKLKKITLPLQRRWIRRARRVNVSRPSVINPELATHLHPPRVRTT
jgi:hypothetical protein